jgi:protein-tyrosine-phosphatase
MQWLSRKHRWPLEDPVRVEGNEEEIMLSFRLIRDQIKEFVEQLIEA